MPEELLTEELSEEEILDAPEEGVEEEQVEEETEEERPEEEEGEKEEEEEPGFEGLEQSAEGTSDPSIDLSAVSKNFPGLLKQHPEIKELVDRDMQYRELFPKLGQASDALRQSKALQDLNREVFQDGSLQNLLTTIHTQDKASLARVARALPEQLFNIDKQAYIETAKPIINEALGAFVERLDKNPDQKIRRMGRNFVSAMAKFVNGGNLPDPGQQKVQDIEERDRRYFASRAQDANNYVGGKVVQTISKNLQSKLSHLDEFTRTSAEKAILERIDEVFRQDSVFQSKRSQMWRAAQEANFSTNSLDAIARAMLTHVKDVLPRVRGEILNKVGSPTAKRNKRSVVPRKDSTTGKSKGFSSEDYDKYTDEQILAM